MDMRINILFSVALLGVLAPLAASAQPVLAQRCNSDNLVAAAAEARVNWARRCALVYRINNPAAWFDTGVLAANGGNLREYAEYDPDINFWGQNSWTGSMHFFEINYFATSSTYLSGSTSQFTDALGYYRWERPLNRKRPRALYPVYGNGVDLNSATNRQIFPHPTNPNDCFFYFDRQGTVPATGSFFVNGFCEQSGLMAEGGASNEEGLDSDEAEELARQRIQELSSLNRLIRYKTLPTDPILR